VAHVGLYPADAEAQGIALDTYTTYLKDIDRGRTDGEETGFVKIHVKKGTDKILGATIVSPHAGDMISEVTVAMVGGLGLKTLSKVIHPYPTLAEAIRKTADAWNRTRLTPTVAKLFNKWLSWTR
jgi:pyruvate/2-oxoglutarate dehydrogenase complex dihydrolipoamide dehydrogenase (E3) component